jgi:hypothetical protein
MADNAMPFISVGIAELISKWLKITKVAVSEFALVSRELCRKSYNIDRTRSYPAAEGLQFYSFQWMRLTREIETFLEDAAQRRFAVRDMKQAVAVAVVRAVEKKGQINRYQMAF